LGPFAGQPVTDPALARNDAERCRTVLEALKTIGVARSELEERIKFDLAEVTRLKREDQQRIAAHQQEIREREHSQYSEIAASLPALVRGYDFSRVVELLKDTRFETPEVQTAMANKLYLWTKAQEFIQQLTADVNRKGCTGTVSRRAGSPIQGRMSKMDLVSTSFAMARGEITVPTETITPDSLLAMAQQFSSDEHDSTEFYRRRELIAVFAKISGLDEMAHAVSSQLMEENRLFRHRWTLVEQSGS
jgi:leucyl aminopeptidase